MSHILLYFVHFVSNPSLSSLRQTCHIKNCESFCYGIGHIG